MAFDKWIAALFLAGAIAYAYAAFTYPLLPFERNLAFLPNTLPRMLSLIAMVLAVLILITPPAPAGEGEVPLGSLDLGALAKMKVGQGLLMILAMILYALALRPLGFVGSTVLFLAGTGLILGERRVLLLVGVSVLGAGIVWALVDAVLGIFLRPLPWFLS